ncbi:MAG TPA: hypothetical protein VGJ87_07445 [Roseiflexaceae bacterium]|jgi:hypothetical protein
MQPVFQLSIAGLASLWVIWALREPPERAAVAVGVPVPRATLLAAEAQSDLLDLEG